LKRQQSVLMNSAGDKERQLQAALPIELELLLACARPQLTEETAARVTRLAEEVCDWDKLIRLSLRHKVMPLLFRRLNTLCPQAAPPHVLERLRELFYQNAARNHFLLDELRHLAVSFAAEEIPLIAYKGPLLAQEAYGDVALRQFNDLDVMVHPKDMQRVSHILRQRGYAPQWNLTRAQETAYLRGDCERLFALKDGQVFLDVHWAVVRNYFALKLDYESFWRRAKFVSLAETPISSFAPEDLLIILSVHASKDLWTRLIWICDIAAIISDGAEPDWQRVLNEAESSGAQRMLLLGLKLAQDMLSVTLPAEVSRKILADTMIETLAREVRLRLFQTDARPANSLTESLFHLKAHERLSDRARYLSRYLTTTNPADWNFVSLPDSLFFLYYLVRPLRLLTRPR
jgi:hypothetical protein